MFDVQWQYLEVDGCGCHNLPLWKNLEQCIMQLHLLIWVMLSTRYMHLYNLSSCFLFCPLVIYKRIWAQGWSLEGIRAQAFAPLFAHK